LSQQYGQDQGQSQGYQQPGDYQAPGYGQPGQVQPQGYGQGGGVPQQQGGNRPGYFMGRPLAGWGARVGATLVDGLICAVPLIVLALIATAIGAAGDGEGAMAGFAGVLLILGYVLTVGLGIYNTVFKQGKTGQTWGKGVLKIRLVKMETGQPIGAGMAFVRSLCHILDSFFYIGYLWPLWDDLRQTFADKIMGTVVMAEGR
jgi:uncharacterized RDD family membrane protein YckC